MLKWIWIKSHFIKETTSTIHFVSKKSYFCARMWCEWPAKFEKKGVFSNFSKSFAPLESLHQCPTFSEKPQPTQPVGNWCYFGSKPSIPKIVQNCLYFAAAAAGDRHINTTPPFFVKCSYIDISH